MAEKEISRPPAPPPLPRRPIDARIDAEKMARQIGDEEWERGNTKYALEAWEASDITALELFELTQKLLEAERITFDANRDIQNTFTLASKVPPGKSSHQAFQKDCAENGCVRCKAHLAIFDNYDQMISELLGFERGVARNLLGAGTEKTIFRAAAVACLKLIKRMR